MGRRSSGSTPSRIASPRRSSSMRPTSGVDSAHARLAEFPPETTASSTPAGDLDLLGQAGELVHLLLVGDDAALARQVRPDAGEHAGRGGGGPTGPSRPRRPWRRPRGGHRARPSAPRRGSWPAGWRPRRARASTVSSVLRLTSAWRTTASTWLGIGERTSVSGASKPRWRRAARFSTRESPRPTTPASTSARATFGLGQHRLGDPDDPDAPPAEAGDEVAGVVPDRLEVDLEARCAHGLADAVGMAEPREAVSSGKASSTMSTSRLRGRVRGSVAGTPSSSS